MDNLTDHQPHLTVALPSGDVAVIPLYLIRQVASGKHIADNELSRAIAVALMDYIDGF